MKTLKEVLDRAKKIVFLGGAGLSTESGIPDFRSSDGVFKAVKAYGVPPEALLSIDFFEEYPEIFYDYYKKFLIYPDAKPNKAHLALAKLEADGRLNAVVTQNIDGLHQAAGSKHVCELHGSVYRNHCVKCRRFYSLEQIMKTDGVPTCDCGGIIKPDVVLYEEGLDNDTIEDALHEIVRADLLIVGGTSLTVYPAAGFLSYSRGSRLVLINRDPTPRDDMAQLIIRDPIGKVLAQMPDA